LLPKLPSKASTNLGAIHLEEIAFQKGWITAINLEAIAKPLAKNEYGKYLLSLL